MLLYSFILIRYLHKYPANFPCFSDLRNLKLYKNDSHWSTVVSMINQKIILILLLIVFGNNQLYSKRFTPDPLVSYCFKFATLL